MAWIGPFVTSSQNIWTNMHSTEMTFKTHHSDTNIHGLTIILPAAII